MEVRVLGPVEARVDGRAVPLGGPKQRTVLALLVAEHGRAVSADSLIDGVWGEDPTPGARGTLQTYVSNLRAHLGGAVMRDSSGYRLEIEPHHIDAVVFEDTAGAARDLVAARPMEASQRIRDALALWRGHPFAGTSPSLRLEAEESRLDELRIAAVGDRIDAELRLGYDAELVGELEVLCIEHPLRERFRAQHMLALYRSGRQAEALRAFEKTRRYLGEELGLDASVELRELEQRILDQDPSLLLDVHPRVETKAFLMVGWDDPPSLDRPESEAWARRLQRVIEQAGGRVLRRSGAGLDAVFADVGATVRAAEAAHRELAGGSAKERSTLVRMVVDVGDVEARVDEYVGPPLTRGARLLVAAHPGQVLLSVDAHARLSTDARGWRAKALGEHDLRGIDRAQPVFQLIVDGLPAEFPPLRTDRPPPLSAIGAGRTVRGYELREPLGADELGVVYRAYQPAMGREVAVRSVRSDLVNRTEFIARFEAEARLVAGLEHPHIVKLFDYWREPDGAYLVTQWPGGGSLEDERNRSWSPEQGLALIQQIGSALAYAHRRGISHGGLTPDKVLLDDDGNALLSGFRIAADSDTHQADAEVGVAISVRRDLRDLASLASTLLLDADGGDGRDHVRTLLEQAAADDSPLAFETADAFVDALTEAAGKAASAPALTAARNPYKGLRSFGESDEADFHGRRRMVADLLHAIADHRLVAVVGPSGIGKSSVVRAGVIPAVRRGEIPGSDRWLITDMTPGPNPFDELGTALSRVATRELGNAPDDMARGYLGIAEAAESLLPPEASLLLVVDQFEELFTLAPDEETRRRFMDGLTELIGDEEPRFRVVLTLRADYLDGPLRYPGFGELLREGMVVVAAPLDDEVAEAIRLPAENLGITFEPGLVDRIVDDVRLQPGGLPLLQYALTELFARRRSDTLTFDDYEATGGVIGALGSRAEALYEHLGPSARRVAPDVFLRLVAVEESGRHTRRRVRRRELRSLEAGLAAVDEVVDRYGDHRLLTFDHDPGTRGPTVEVAHEALLDRWDRFRHWIEERREDLLLHDRLAAAVREWRSNHEEAAYLIHGGRLQHLEEWARSTGLGLTADERRFLAQSRTTEDSHRERRRRIRHVVTSGFAIAALIVSILAALAYASRQDAIAQRNTAITSEQRAEQGEARAREEAARSRLAEEQARDEALRARASELSAFATAALGSDPALAKLLVLAAAEMYEPSLDTVSLLHQAWAADPVVGRYLWPEDREVGFMWAQVSPDGTRLVAAGCGCDVPSTYLEVYDLENDQVIWSFEVENENIIVDAPLFSPDGEIVAAGLYWLGEDEPTDGPLGVLLWETSTGNLLEHFDLGRCGGSALAFSGTHLVTDRVITDTGCFYRNMTPPALQLIELGSGSTRTLTPRMGLGVTMSDDGRYVAYGDRSGPSWTSVVEDVFTAERIFEIDAVTDQRAVALNEDGSLLLLALLNRAEVWDLGLGERLSTFDGHPDGLWSAIFSTAGDDTVYSTSQDGTLLHWEAVTGERLAAFVTVGNGNVSMTRTGLLVVADRTARTASLIDTRHRGEIWATDVSSCQGPVTFHSLSVGGSHLAISQFCFHDRSSNTVVIDAETRTVTRVVPGGRFPTTIISPDGFRFARIDVGIGPMESGREEWFGPFRVRDTLTGEVLTELQGMCTWDFRLFQAAGVKGAEQDGCFAYPGTPFPMLATQIFWSPDVRRVAAWNWVDPLFAVWDTETGELLSGYAGCSDPRGVLFEGNEWIIYCADSEAPRFIRVDAGTGTEVDVVEVPRFGPDELGLIGYTPDGRFLLALRGFHEPGGGSLLWLDPRTFAISHALERVHEGQPSSFATSPSGRVIATSSSDGFVKVWDVEERRQIHEIYLGEVVSGVAFVDERHLAVVTLAGYLHVHTLDVGELMQILRDSLTRGFTDAECQRYGFGDDCPRWKR